VTIGVGIRIAVVTSVITKPALGKIRRAGSCLRIVHENFGAQEDSRRRIFGGAALKKIDVGQAIGMLVQENGND